MSTYAGTAQLLRLAWRRDRWIILPSVLALVGLASSSMAATLALYPTDADAAQAAALMTSTPSIAAIYGPLSAPTRAGVGVLKTVLLGGIFLAFLAFALVRRHTRSEEESGRAELLAAGVVGRRAPLAAAVLLAGASVLVTAVLAGGSIATAGVSGAMALTVAWLIIGLVTVGITAVAVQLTTTTRGAGAIALGVIGAMFLVRAIGDTAVGSAQNLTWFSYLGWAEKVSPFGANRLWLLLPALALTTALLLVADRLLQHRDLGAGLLPARPGPAGARRHLSSATALALRLHRGALIGWGIAYAVLGAVVGSMAGSVDQIANTPAVQEMLRQMSGGHGSMTEIFLGTEVRFMAIGASAFGIAAVLRARSEEASGRAELLLSTPVARLGWLAGHAGIASLGAVWLMLLAGTCAAATARRAPGAPGLADLIVATAATLPAVLITIALAVLLLGWLPVRSPFAWAILAIFLALGEFGALLKLPASVIGLSPFDHVGSLPGGRVQPAALLAMTLIAIAVGAIGAAGLRRRDLPA